MILNDNKFQKLLGKQAITEVLHQYCRGADRCDEAQMMSFYHPKVIDQYNFFSGNGQYYPCHR